MNYLHSLRHEYHQKTKKKLKIISSMPGNWKHIIKPSGFNAKNFFTYDHHLLKASMKLSTEKLI